MDITLTDEEMALVTEALQALESDLAESTDSGEDRLKEVRKLFQRLQTLHTAK